MTKKVWYSIQSSCEGIVDIQLMESKELCEINQKHPMPWEGLESLGSGSLMIRSDSPVIEEGGVATVEVEILLTTEYLKDEDLDHDERALFSNKLIALRRLQEASREGS